MDGLDEEQYVDALASNIFKNWRQTRTLQDIIREEQRWAKMARLIKSLTIEEMAKRCDFVTERVLQYDSTIVIPWARKKLNKFFQTTEVCNVCAKCNIAALICAFPDGLEKEDFKLKFRARVK